MESRSIRFTTALVVLLLLNHVAGSQGLPGYTFRIVNMIPNAMSEEVANDAETNMAVNPMSPSVIVGSAFTPNPTGSTTEAPIFVSSDGGTTWAINNIVPSGTGATNDISLAFGSSSGNLYAGILRSGYYFRPMILRTSSPFASTMMTVLADRPTEVVDQPFISALTANDATSIPRDRVFSGDNLFGSTISIGSTGRTAEVMFSNNAGSAPPSGFANTIVEQRTTFEQDMPATRVAIHPSGVVYAIYYRWVTGEFPFPQCEVIVVRDDNFATGPTPFRALVDGVDRQIGKRVVADRLVPFGLLGANRLVASNLAIAVDPTNSANVFIAWCDRLTPTDYTLHFRKSTDSGQSWGTSDWLTITDATNPGIAITEHGSVGLVYQQLTGPSITSDWETHFRFTATTGTTFTDDILSIFPNVDLQIAAYLYGFLGDYLRIQAVGDAFYGVFPAGSRAILSNFPHSVAYNRNVDFTTHELRNLDNTYNISPTVDPFFFKIAPIFRDICALHPELCELSVIDRRAIRLPPYPECLNCPWPCLSCPSFEIKIEDVYKEAYSKPPQTILTIPYFHLLLDGYSPQDFDVVVVNGDREAIKQEVNKTDKGFAISFRPSRNNFSAGKGLHGLKIMALPRNETLAKTGAAINFQLEASDYRYKEFAAKRK